MEWSAQFFQYAIPCLTVREYGWVRRWWYGCAGELGIDRGVVVVVMLSLN